MVIYMDQYRKANALNVAEKQWHATEKLCVNGNTASGVIAMPLEPAFNDLSPQLPEDFSNIDMTALYSRVQALASQI